jgi:hypothetical protein
MCKTGLPDFSWSKKNQDGEKYTKLPQNLPTGHKIYPMAVKKTKWSYNTYTKILYSKTPKLGFLV